MEAVDARGRGSSPSPTATRRSGPRCAPSSTPPGRGRRSTGWPSSIASPEPYARLAHEQLSAAGIALNGAAVMPLTARVAGRTLLELLALPEGGFRREDVFAWLAGARLRRQGASSRSPPGSGCRVTPGVGGRARRLGPAPGHAGRRASTPRPTRRGDPDAPPWRAERRRRTRPGPASSGRSSWADRRPGRAAPTPRPWGERAAWARRHLATCSAASADGPPGPRRAEGGRTGGAGPRPAGLPRRRRGAGGPRRLHPHLRARARGRPRPGRAAWARGCSSARRHGGRTRPRPGGRPRPGRGPVPLSHPRRLPPPRPRALSRRRRAAPAVRQVESQHRQLLAALAGASRHVLCVPRGDLAATSSGSRRRWVLQIASALAGETLVVGRTSSRPGEAPWLDHVASFDAGLRQVAFPPPSRSTGCARAHGPDRPRRRSRDAWPTRSLPPARTVVAARRSRRFTRFDGNLAGLDRPVPGRRRHLGHPARGLGVCPFAYLLRDVLGVERGREPRGRLEITPLDGGRSSTRSLEQFIAEVLARPEAEQPAPPSRGRRSDRGRLLEIAERLCADYEARGRHRPRRLLAPGQAGGIIADLDRFLELDDRHRASTAPGRWRPSWPSASPAPPSAPSPRAPRRPVRPLPG